MSEVVTWKGPSQLIASTGGLPRRPLVVVVGMHRSGLMVCAALLAMLGVDMGDTFETRNVGGDRPPDELMDLQDDVLALFDRRVETAMHDYPMPPAWWVDGRIRPIVNRMKELLSRRLAQPGLVGLQDQRLPKLMPLWNRIFADLGLVPRYVVCLRDPAQVARSLETREGLDLDTGEFRSLDYTVDCIRYTTGADRLFLRFSQWSSEPAEIVGRLQAFIGGAAPIQSNDLDVALGSLLRPRGRTGEATTIARQPLVRHFFEMLYAFAESDGADAVLADRIRSFADNYIAFRQLLGPFETKHRMALNGQSASVRDAPAAPPIARGGPGEDLAAARARQAAAEASSARLGETVATIRDAHARLEQSLRQSEEANMALSRELDDMRESHAALERSAAQSAGSTAALTSQLEEARKGRFEAEARVTHLEVRLHDHSVALSDTIAALSAAEQGRGHGAAGLRKRRWRPW